MNHDGYFFSQTFLQCTQMGSFSMFSNQLVYFIFTKRSENLDVPRRIIITYIEPELIKFIRRCISCIEPHITRFCFTKLSSICFSYKRTGQRISLTTICTTNQFSPRSNVTPLIGATHLQLTTFGFIQMKKIIPLQQLISKFSE